MAGDIDTKRGTPTVHGRTSAYTDPEVKRSKVNVAAWNLHLNKTVNVSSFGATVVVAIFSCLLFSLHASAVVAFSSWQ